MKSTPFIALVTLGLILLALSAHGQTNLIPNGSFESEASTGFTEGWRGTIDDKKNPPEMYVKDGKAGEDTHTGSHSIKLFTSEFGAAGQEAKRRNVLEVIKSNPSIPEPPIHLEPGKNYRFSFWLKREGFDDPSQSLMVEFDGLPYPNPGSARNVLGTIGKMTGPCDWEKRDFLISVPQDSNIAEGYVIFRLLFPSTAVGGGSKSTAYIDDIELVQEN